MKQEQEALKLVSRLHADQQQLLAGKFKDAEALEQAYLELQSKLGEPREEPEAEPVEEEGESEEDLKMSQKMVLLLSRKPKPCKNSVGGEERYNEMIQWAADNLSPDEIKMFDNVVGTGDKDACFFAINSLNQRFTAAVGEEKPLLTGRGSRDTYGCIP